MDDLCAATIHVAPYMASILRCCLCTTEGRGVLTEGIAPITVPQAPEQLSFHSSTAPRPLSQLDGVLLCPVSDSLGPTLSVGYELLATYGPVPLQFQYFVIYWSTGVTENIPRACYGLWRRALT